ncbi:lytic murein transglycosylase [Mesorhizobium sp. M4B.F.Ca.ET.215.01.1.1]|nr:lytic murein transglycosylase [Mesorhizobium sp. M4B.F.Ca.ET.019.03.1.1]RWF64272.1 MAG: lytic murein transglycosylase [Mesorhizobium sp.]TGQ12884.1 lytic murein transglycosylase [Mesorhizobium sp. M4B.F.Ca.ET.215.01.1.1]TGQ43195.1 lytic murein transglycosylase [Mesorhizobium sp. M4B.F.Ca.ET.214.01.1.1]TGQ46494.1 lytic murein transglycosylase [Mesorhizobium sp. M00.F.Ca.ET.220.01.1.1]TGQ62009.1 lytic murein transglycosylase [Mesorhizobium sp. M4B.F.Ca.ET.211.01.1.1]TGR06098.1 lytic murein t
MLKRWRDSTPLWPAGHLPLKGGVYSLRRLRQFRTLRGCAPALKPPISPLEGEMPGRAGARASLRSIFPA